MPTDDIPEIRVLSVHGRMLAIPADSETSVYSLARSWVKSDPVASLIPYKFQKLCSCDPDKISNDFSTNCEVHQVLLDSVLGLPNVNPVLPPLGESVPKTVIDPPNTVLTVAEVAPVSLVKTTKEEENLMRTVYLREHIHFFRNGRMWSRSENRYRQLRYAPRLASLNVPLPRLDRFMRRQERIAAADAAAVEAIKAVSKMPLGSLSPSPPSTDYRLRSLDSNNIISQSSFLSKENALTAEGLRETYDLLQKVSTAKNGLFSAPRDRNEVLSVPRSSVRLSAATPQSVSALVARSLASFALAGNSAIGSARAAADTFQPEVIEPFVNVISGIHPEVSAFPDDPVTDETPRLRGKMRRGALFSMFDDSATTSSASEKPLPKNEPFPPISGLKRSRSLVEETSTPSGTGEALVFHNVDNRARQIATLHNTVKSDETNITSPPRSSHDVSNELPSPVPLHIAAMLSTLMNSSN